jgi:hypothetical protein
VHGYALEILDRGWLKKSRLEPITNGKEKGEAHRLKAVEY